MGETQAALDEVAGDWFGRTVVATGRLPLFCFFAAVIVAFAFIRFSVRMIRRRARWWPGNVTTGDLHIHHVVFGVVFMMVAGVAQLALSDDAPIGRAVCAAVFGVGAALVLDEFAVILHLRDVYWSEQGRTSVDAVFVAIAITGMLLLGLRPIGLDDLAAARHSAGPITRMLPASGWMVLNLSLAIVSLLKGKIWTGLFGLFVPILQVFGAVRLARPGSPWARWRYAERTLARARRRELRLRLPLIRVKIRFQELISGRHDEPSR
ncbi:MAG TPA: hypothetical protein VGL93_12385 [Streptosporangiaceae bacterium]